jgi:hypothetical protein
MRSIVIGVALVALAATSLWVSEANAQSREVAGIVTEIKLGTGAVEVKPVGAADWRPAAPLMGLLVGDNIRASEGASAVVLLSGGRGALRVEGGGAPVVIPASDFGESKVRKAQAILAASLNFFNSRARELPQTVLGTRGMLRTPLVLAPRNGSVLAGAVSVEWLGNPSGRYTVQIVGPAGVVLERRGATEGRLTNPPEVRALEAGQHYSVRVTLEGTQRSDQAWFEVLSGEQTHEVHESLATLTRELVGSVPPNTLVALRAGFLADRGLLDAARREVLAALAKDRDEPTLYLILGSIYTQVGLSQQADEAYQEARSLMTARAR